MIIKYLQKFMIEIAKTMIKSQKNKNKKCQ